MSLENHAASAATTSEIAGEYLTPDALKALATLLITIYVTDDEKTIEAAVKHLVDSLPKGVITSGTHANGYIAPYMRDEARQLAGQFHTGGSDEFQQCVMVLRHFYEALQTLKTENQGPWLRAENQIRFQLMVRETRLGLQAIKVREK